MRFLHTLALAIVATSVACSTLKLNTDYDPGTDFSTYKTFTFKEGSKARNPVSQRSIEYALQTALEGRGLRAATGTGADIFVYTHFILEENIRIETYGYGMTGWYGYGWGGVGQTEVRRIPVGTVLIDFVDSRSNKLVWRGLVKDEISTTAYPEEREKKAIDIAKKLLANYPPAPGKK